MSIQGITAFGRFKTKGLRFAIQLNLCFTARTPRVQPADFGVSCAAGASRGSGLGMSRARCPGGVEDFQRDLKDETGTIGLRLRP